MYEIDFLPVGEGSRSGDAIALRFTRPDTGRLAHVIIDAGFGGDGDDLVRHVRTVYGTDTVDLAILTHPDGDHIGGMGEVVRGLHVTELWLHRIGAHGGSSLPAATAVEDLIGVANDHGTDVWEVWPGVQRFGGALTVIGPDEPYYDELVAQQVAGEKPLVTVRKTLTEAVRGVFDRVASALGQEVALVEQEVNARNNSSMINLFIVDGRRLLFTADAGVPALDRAWDFASENALAGALSFVQIPHHGSRRNASSAWLDRVLGPVGQAPSNIAMVSVVADSEDHPSGRVINAYQRRGWNVLATAGERKYSFFGVPLRAGWYPADALPPMIEEDDD